MSSALATSSSWSSTARAFRGECRAELLKTFRSPEFTVPTLVLPVAFYALFALILSGGGATPRHALATFGVFSSLGPALFGFGGGLALEREQGLLALKRVSPMPVAATLIAKLVMCLLFTAISVLSIAALAALAGGVVMPRSAWVTLLALHLAGTIPFGLLGLTLGSLMKGSSAMAITNLVFMGLAVGGGLWIPIDFFPGWLQQVSLALPTYHLAELALIVVGRTREHAASFHLVAMAIFVAACGLAAVISLNRRRP